MREGNEWKQDPRERIDVLGTAAFIAKGNLHLRQITKGSQNRCGTHSLRVSIRSNLLIACYRDKTINCLTCFHDQIEDFENGLIISSN